MQNATTCPISATIRSETARGFTGANPYRFKPSVSGVDMAQENKIANVGRHLTSEETVELARIQADPSVIGYAIVGLDGTEIEASGAWSSMIAPVFSNVFELSDRIGAEFGEEDGCPMLFMENPNFEVIGLRLTSARVVIVKRKGKRASEGLRSVG